MATRPNNNLLYIFNEWLVNDILNYIITKAHIKEKMVQVGKILTEISVFSVCETMVKAGVSMRFVGHLFKQNAMQQVCKVSRIKTWNGVKVTSALSSCRLIKNTHC